jgi:hypothetical protein
VKKPVSKFAFQVRNLQRYSGVPSVAAHGWSAAHELVPFWKQCEMLDKVCP